MTSVKVRIAEHLLTPVEDPSLYGINAVTQSIMHVPENVERGVFGNCFQAAIASLLRLPIEAVPHFVTFLWWDAAVELWARGRWFNPHCQQRGRRSVDAGIRLPRSLRTGAHRRHRNRMGLSAPRHRLANSPHPYSTRSPASCGFCGVSRSQGKAGGLRNNNTMATPYAVDSIISHQWGYDQTNYDFFRIVKRSGDWVTLQPLETIHETDGRSDSMRTLATPGPVTTEPTIRRRICYRDGNPIGFAINRSYGWAREWSGSPERATHYA